MIDQKLINDNIEKYNSLLCVECGKLMVNDYNEINLFLQGKKSRRGSGDGCVIIPKNINGNNYRRKRCFGCFEIKFGRKPKKLNKMNYDMCYLFDVTEEEVLKEMQKYSLTEENMTKKYGKEEGKRRWSEYCRKHSYKNTFEGKKEKYGWSREQFDEFNRQRAVTKKNMVKKYGKEEGEKKWKAYCERQAYAGCAKEYFIEKYGLEEGERKWKEVNMKKAITLGNFTRKYGKELGLERYKEATDHKQWSKISDELLDKVVDLYSNKAIIYTHNNNGEYVFWCGSEKNSYYCVDFYDIRQNKVIEFYGGWWHCDKENIEENYYHPLIKKTAKEVWEADEEREKFLKDRYGVKILIIKEKDYRKNKEEEFRKCCEFLGVDNGI